jgi:hypothetical protein
MAKDLLAAANAASGRFTRTEASRSLAAALYFSVTFYSNPSLRLCVFA